MNTHDQAILSAKYPRLVTFVAALIKKDVSRDDAWLTAGALFAYTGIAKIPDDIVKAANAQKTDFPKVVGEINAVLQGQTKGSKKHENLLEILKNIERLPNYVPPGRQDPTRMMDAYADIDEHYKVGNVLLMGEVGSVCRHRPAPGYYQKKYRIHISGGLKDITTLNPRQQELVYAPYTPYLVKNKRIGKVKAKKGNQAHHHIYLEYAPGRKADGIDLARLR